MAQQREIKAFIDEVMEEKKRIRFEYYEKINKEISSEMVMSMMVLLHNNIPCAKNIFRMRENFRQTLEDESVGADSSEEFKSDHKRGSLKISTEERKRPQRVNTGSLLASPNIMKSFKFADTMSQRSSISGGSGAGSQTDLGDLYRPNSPMRNNEDGKKLLQGGFFDKRR